MRILSDQQEIEIQWLLVANSNITSILKEIITEISDSSYLLTSIKNDRYQTKRLEQFEEGNLNYAFEIVVKLIKIWFQGKWIPKIFASNHKIIELTEKLNEFNFSEEINLFFDLDNLVIYLRAFTLNFIIKIQNFSFFLDQNLKIEYSNTDYFMNFPFFSDILSFIKSLVIFPYKISRGNSYLLLIQMDKKVENILNNSKKFKINLLKKNH